MYTRVSQQGDSDTEWRAYIMWGDIVQVGEEPCDFVPTQSWLEVVCEWNVAVGVFLHGAPKIADALVRLQG